MRIMGIEAIYPRPNTSKAHPEHRIYPYLLRGREAKKINDIWSSDITYIRLSTGWFYLVVVMDWYSRYVLSWETSTTLEKDFCISAAEKAYSIGKPEIFNTDQGSQFTSLEFVKVIKENGSQMSMDGRGRAMDNIFTERFWRSIKYENIYLKDYVTVEAARQGIAEYIEFYNNHRLHQSLGYRTPKEIHFST